MTPSEVLRARQSLTRVIRAWFAAADYLELQAPTLVRGTCPDAYICSFQVGDRYLTTSTEYHIKRLLAAGEPRVYTLQANFRAGDLGEVHSPEFWMLEWGRAGATLAEIEADLEAIFREAARVLHGRPAIPLGDTWVSVAEPFRRVTVADALAAELGVAPGDYGAAALEDAANRAGIADAPRFTGDVSALFTLLLDALQQRLGHDGPVWLTDWPAFLGSSVATTSAGTVTRSELFVRGLELSDGFPFVSDEAGQRARFAAANDQRAAQGLPRVALDERYLRALPALPPGAGMAVGFERLLMALTGANTIDEVLPFPWRET